MVPELGGAEPSWGRVRGRSRAPGPSLRGGCGAPVPGSPGPPGRALPCLRGATQRRLPRRQRGRPGGCCCPTAFCCRAPEAFTDIPGPPQAPVPAAGWPWRCGGSSAPIPRDPRSAGPGLGELRSQSGDLRARGCGAAICPCCPSGSSCGTGNCPAPCPVVPGLGSSCCPLSRAATRQLLRSLTGPMEKFYFCSLCETCGLSRFCIVILSL